MTPLTRLSFEITGARPDTQSLTPVLQFPLTIVVDPEVVVQSAQLHCQIRIEPDRRTYADDEQTLVADLFGAPQQWRDTLKPFLLTHVTLPVRGFAGSTEVDLPVEVSYDLEVAAGKYLHALRGGEVPLLFLFSGTLFLQTPEGLRIQQVPWDLEARYRLPVTVWDDLMELHFPGTGWLRLRRETLDALQRYKSRNALATWDDVIRFLMSEHETSR